jgi:UPF0755 protein
LRRYDRYGSRDREDLEARLNALRQPTKNTKKHRRKRRSGAGPAVFGVLILLLAAVAGYMIFSSATGGGGEPAQRGKATIEVVEGDSLSSVASKLKAAGVIENETIFKLQARMGGEGTQIKPGEYTFGRDESGDEILGKLTTGKDAPTYSVTIPEGLTLEQTAQQVADSKSGISAEEFKKAAGQTNYGYAFLDDPAIKNTEGFLFPKKYEFERGTEPRVVVDRMLNQYLIETEGLDFGEARRQLNLTEYEVLTTASLIEREAATPEERPIIASVIYNRIRQGIPLQIDATIQYARGEPKEDLSLQDLEIDSPYNTYKNPGLPPGPIASPSLGSIQAALNPADTDYLYYVLKANGEEHYFTNDYDDFLRAKEEAGR